MSFAGKVGRGLLAGAAGYYGKLAENQEFDRRAEALQMREQAYARLNQTIRNEDADTNLKRTKSLTSFQTDEQIRGEATMLPAREAAQSRKESREEARDRAAEERRFKIWQQQQNIELSHDKARILYQAETSASHRAGEEDPITHWDIDEQTGTKVGFTARGRVFDTGVKVPQKGEQEPSWHSKTQPTSSPSTPSTSPTPGTVITDAQGRRMRLNENGRWVPMPRGR